MLHVERPVDRQVLDFEWRRFVSRSNPIHVVEPSNTGLSAPMLTKYSVVVPAARTELAENVDFSGTVHGSRGQSLVSYVVRLAPFLVYRGGFPALKAESPQLWERPLHALVQIICINYASGS